MQVAGDEEWVLLHVWRGEKGFLEAEKSMQLLPSAQNQRGHQELEDANRKLKDLANALAELYASVFKYSSRRS